jgi:hypothetical protein
MARTTVVEVTRACGHVEQLEVRGDPARSAYLDNARMRDCGRCYREKQTAADTDAVTQGKRCELEGSERQVAWAQGIRQKRAVEFGRMLNDATAWAKVQAGRGDPLAVEVVRERVRAVQNAISGLFLGKAAWTLLDQDGNEALVASYQARWWIDTRELEVRDMLATLLPQYRWEAYRDWEPVFREEVEVVDQTRPFDDDDDEVMPVPAPASAPAPAPAPAPAAALEPVVLTRLADVPRRAPKAAEKPAPKPQMFEDDDIPF